MTETRFGRYVVTGELGRGAMGSVFRATDPLIERDVAIKTLLTSLPEEVLNEVRERFIREAKSAGRLNHPNVVTIYDVGEENGVAYIAMELLEGRSLQDVVRSGDRLPFERISDLVAQVADGLGHAHGLGIVHRDVKPANVMVSSDWRAKLTDFGVAHVASSSMTQTGSSLGSPKYMSPEQVLGQPVSARSDLFSLGILLYELLVRRTPFERPGDTTVFAMMNRIAREPHPPLRDADPAIPDAFEQVVTRALAKAEADRYGSAGEMAADLRAIVAGGRPLAAAAPRADEAADRTVVLPGSAGRAADVTVPRAPKAPTADTTHLLADVDAFSRSFEEEEQNRLRMEEEARARKKAQLEEWAEAERARQEAFESTRAVPGSKPAAAAGRTAGATAASSTRSSALDLIRKKASAPAPEQKADRSRRNAELDEKMRSAFQYLSEFVVVLNEAHPVADLPYQALFVGDIKGAILSQGFTDYRSRDVDGKDRIDHVVFKYRISSPGPVRFEVTGDEQPRVQDRLKALGIKFDLTEQKNEFGQVRRARFTVTGPFPCQAVLRADYEHGGVAFELVNVRRFGSTKFRVRAEDFDDALVEEFGTYVLGADDALAKRLAK